MKRLIKFLGLTAVAALAACGTDENGNPVNPVAALCGFSCPGDTVDGSKVAGVAEGNASITGVAQVDAFFSAVIGFETAATDVSAGIQEQLDAIAADFEIQGDLAAGLKTQFDANLMAGISVDYQPARCAVDAQATIEASAQCDVEASAGMVAVECQGSCDAEVSANVACDASAEVYCTFTAPEVACMGECQGSCDVMLEAAAACDGVCKGSCDGECSGYVKNASGELECNGSCSGMCTGSCEAKLAAAAECKGTCRGECSYTPPMGNCEGAVKAECRAMADAKIMCQGRCEGEVEPPMVSAECKAAAKAQASVNVECTPPRLAVNYGFKADASAKFKAALTTLIDVRLPALLKAAGKAKLVANAGEGLSVAASGAVQGAVDTLKGEFDLKVAYNLTTCVPPQLGSAKSIITSSTGTLTDKLNATKKVTAMLGFDA